MPVRPFVLVERVSETGSQYIQVVRCDGDFRYMTRDLYVLDGRVCWRSVGAVRTRVARNLWAEFTPTQRENYYNSCLPLAF